MTALIISGAADLRREDLNNLDFTTFTSDAQTAPRIERRAAIAVNGVFAADGAGTSFVGQASGTLHLAGTGYWTNSPYPYLTGLKSGSRMVGESLGTSRRPRNFPARSAEFHGRSFDHPRAVRDVPKHMGLQPVVSMGARS